MACGGNAFGEGRSFMSLRNARSDAAESRKLYLPAMIGRAGNIVALMPNSMTGIRLAKNWDGNEAADGYIGMANVAERLAGCCHRSQGGADDLARFRGRCLTGRRRRTRSAATAGHCASPMQTMG